MTHSKNPGIRLLSFTLTTHVSLVMLLAYKQCCKIPSWPPTRSSTMKVDWTILPPSPLNFPNSVFGKCAKCLAKITQMKSYIEKHMFVHLTSKLTSGRNQPRVACVSWTVSPDINWAECEAEHSVQSSAQFKKPPWNTHRQHLPLYLHFVSQGAGITELYECPSPITFSISVLLKALGTVVSIVNKLWAWWSMVWFPVWARDSSLLKTKSVAHKASYSMAAAGFWTFNLLALKLRINGGKTLHPLLALFCCQLCKKPDP